MTLQRVQPESPRRVIVIGGGLAGMAAAVALESAGVRVTLIEARGSLGGRAGSFIDPQSGEELDCQHLLLGCCTSLIDFYQRIGALGRIAWERTVRFVDTRASWRLSATPRLPAPLHLALSAMRLGSPALGRAMAAMMRLGPAGRRELADVEFGQWLRDHGQDDRLLRLIYDPLLRGALNEDPRRASAQYAIQVFQDALLSNSAGYVLGLPDGPLGRLYCGLGCSDLRLGTRVRGLRVDRMRACGVELQGGEVLEADAYISAVNHYTLRKWVTADAAGRDARFAGLDRLEGVPILNAHLCFDRPVLAHTHAALLDGPLQWVFRKDREGRVVHGVISAARAWVDIDREECLQGFADQLRRLLPVAQDAKLVRGMAVIEKRATFSPLPGVDRWRPEQAPPAGGIEGLFLAGDFTQTGWPATMEGAVRSGYLAAECVLERLGLPRQRFLVPDLPPQWPARWMARSGSTR